MRVVAPPRAALDLFMREHSAGVAEIDLEGVPLLGARLLRELHWCGSLEVETALHLKEVGRVLDEKPRYLWNVLGALGRMFNASGT